MIFKKAVVGSKTQRELEILCGWLMEAIELYGWTEHEMFAINTSLIEAINNALMHGNCYDKSKGIVVFSSVSAEVVTIMVRDEGPGFRPDTIPDPRLPDRVFLPNGRGVFLIRNLMDKVLFNNTGNEITMEKYHSSEPLPATTGKVLPFVFSTGDKACQ